MVDIVHHRLDRLNPIQQDRSCNLMRRCSTLLGRGCMPVNSL